MKTREEDYAGATSPGNHQMTAHAPTLLVGGVPVEGPTASSASTERSA